MRQIKHLVSGKTMWIVKDARDDKGVGWIHITPDPERVHPIYQIGPREFEMRWRYVDGKTASVLPSPLEKPQAKKRGRPKKSESSG